MAWCFEDECDRYADGVLGGLLEGRALVPAIWLLEVANVLLVAERRRRITKADTARFLGLLEGLPIEAEEQISISAVFGRVLSHGRELRLTAYDACYVDLAMRLGWPLATRDRVLRSACRKADVEIFSTS
jgi:predicted nucleic acid-binding protein